MSCTVQPPCCSTGQHILLKLIFVSCNKISLLNRKESSFNLGTAETKLLYTLHWVIMDAADECSLQAETDGKLETSTFAYLFPLSAITVSDSLGTWDLQY